MDRQNQRANPLHAAHDIALVASHAAGDLDGSERARAQALVADCASCADLHRDLVAIAAATRALPNLATAPRDFRLAPEQAARLRRGSWLRAALAPFGAARSAARPLAAACTSLGIAGLLVGSALPGLLGSPAALEGARDTASGLSAPTSAPAFAPSAAAGAPNPAAGEQSPAFVTQGGGPDSATTAPGRVAVPVAGGGDPLHGENDGTPKSSDSEAVAAGGLDQGTNPTAETTTDKGGPLRTAVQPPLNLLLVGSLAFLGLGLTLYALRFAVRRLR